MAKTSAPPSAVRAAHSHVLGLPRLAEPDAVQPGLRLGDRPHLLHERVDEHQVVVLRVRVVEQRAVRVGDVLRRAHQAAGVVGFDRLQRAGVVQGQLGQLGRRQHLGGGDQLPRAGGGVPLVHLHLGQSALAVVDDGHEPQRVRRQPRRDDRTQLELLGEVLRPLLQQPAGDQQRAPVDRQGVARLDGLQRRRVEHLQRLGPLLGPAGQHLVGLRPGDCGLHRVVADRPRHRAPTGDADQRQRDREGQRRP